MKTELIFFEFKGRGNTAHVEKDGWMAKYALRSLVKKFLQDYRLFRSPKICHCAS